MRSAKWDIDSDDAVTRSHVLPYDTYPYIYIIPALAAMAITNRMFWSRWKWFWWHAWCTMCAPFYEVRFPAFFLADHFTSITSVLYEAQFIMCLWDSDSVTGFCESGRKWKVPLFTCLPFVWRLLQCFRRYKNQKGSAPHPNLTNAAKYSISLIAILTNFLFGVVATNYGKGSDVALTMEIVWYFCAVVDATSKSIWDVFMDWGLLSGLRRSDAKQPYLRDHVWYPKWTYIAATAYDICGRYLFIMRYYFVTKYGGPALNNWWGFLLFGAIEVLRRNMWSLFRVENEQLNNYESYRAVTITPPPFHNNPISLLFEETDEEIQKRMAGENWTKITQLFHALSEVDQEAVLRFLIPLEESIWTHSRGKTQRFERMHEFEKVIGLVHLFGRLTMEEFCFERGILLNVEALIK